MTWRNSIVVDCGSQVNTSSGVTYTSGEPTCETIIKLQCVHGHSS